MAASTSADRGHLWRSRWAAIGAAVAVTLGGGGAFWVHADSPGPAQPTLSSFIQAREASLGTEAVAPGKTWNPIDAEDLVAQPVDDDVQLLTDGATFFPVTPYRSFDSRLFSDGLLLGGEGVYFEVLTDVDGSPRIPASAVAVTYNLTVTGTFGSNGYLTVYPGGARDPGSSSINWFAPGLDLANGGVVSLGYVDASGQIVVRAGLVPDTATDFIIDVTGYYA